YTTPFRSLPQGVHPAGNPRTAGHRVSPHALHFRAHFAVAVGAHAAARAVAQVLRTVHGARHARGAQDALAAHPTVEQQPLHRAFHGGDRALEPLIADPL